MNRKETQKQIVDSELMKIAQKNGVDFASLQRLLQAEKEKKILRRRINIQQTIKLEIENLYGES